MMIIMLLIDDDDHHLNVCDPPVRRLLYNVQDRSPLATPLYACENTSAIRAPLVGRHTDKPKAINILMIKLVISGGDEEENQT